jgi:hypothetical protein
VLGLIEHCERHPSPDGVSSVRKLVDGLIQSAEFSADELQALEAIAAYGSEPVVTAVPARDALRGRITGLRRAVIVGIDDYAATGLSSLRFAANDAIAFAETMRTFGLYDDRSITLLHGRVTQAQIVQALELASRDLGTRDGFLLFYAGHGVRCGDDATLAPSDFELGTGKRGVSVRGTERILSKVGTVVRFFDACHTGVPAARGAESSAGLAETLILGAAGWLTLAAADHDEVALESAKLQHGLFTAELLHALRGGAGQKIDDIMFADAASVAGFVAWRLRAQNQTSRFAADIPGVHVLTAARLTGS